MRAKESRLAGFADGGAASASLSHRHTRAAVRPLWQMSDRVRSLVSHPWLIEQVNVTVTEDSAIAC